jgi:hypothetical protein
MSFALFFGLPDHRVIRSIELRNYYDFETGRPKAACAKDALGLPEPLQRIYRALQYPYPQRTPGTSGSQSSTSYTLFKTAFLLAVDDPSLQWAVDQVSGIVSEQEALFFDVRNGGWLHAAKPTEDALALSGFTSERCVVKYACHADADLLLDPDWFVDGRFFCLSQSDEQFMQIINIDGIYHIEFRAGAGRPLFRGEENEPARIATFLDGYLAGRNMNDGDFKFSPAAGPDTGEIILPARDASGRWVPPRGFSIAS